MTGLQPTKLLRFPDLKARGIVNNWVTLMAWTRDPRVAFPPGRWIGPNSKAWSEQEIEQWLARRPTERSA